MNATEQSCRVSIRVGDHEADLTVPAHVPVRELLPAIVEATGEDLCGRDLRLVRVGGDPIDPGTTLAHNDVGDGDLLILAPVPPPAPRPPLDACATVAEAVEAATRPYGPTTRRRVLRWAAGWMAAVLAVLLGQPLFDLQAPRYPGVAGAAAAAALAGAVTLRRRDHRVPGPTALGVLAAALAALSGLLTGSGLAGFVLAMSAVASMSLVAWRLLDCAPVVFLPLSGAAMATSAATTAALTGWWPLPAAGPALATGALIILGWSPRLAVRSCGLGSIEDLDAGLRSRAVTAHQRLSLVVVTAAAATAAGAAITAVTTPRPATAAAFISTAAVALLLRLRRHREPYSVAAIALSSAAAATSLICLAAAAEPSSTPWLCGVLVSAAATAVCLGGRGPWLRSPAARRAVAVLDLAVTTAVVPLAAATAGAFATLRETLLP